MYLIKVIESIFQLLKPNAKRNLQFYKPLARYASLKVKAASHEAPHSLRQVQQFKCNTTRFSRRGVNSGTKGTAESYYMCMRCNAEKKYYVIWVFFCYFC